MASKKIHLDPDIMDFLTVINWKTWDGQNLANPSVKCPFYVQEELFSYILWNRYIQGWKLFVEHTVKVKQFMQTPLVFFQLEYQFTWK
jgi:hypothetical protein